MLGAFYFYSRWKRKVASTNGEQFFTQACSKKMEVQTQICFSTRGKRNFPYGNSRGLFTDSVYQLFSIQTQVFSTTHGGYKKFLYKSRTKLYSRCVPKNFYN